MNLLKNITNKKRYDGDTDFEYARSISSKLSNPTSRKEALANLLGILAILGYLRDKGFECSIDRSLHRTSSILEEFKITDIYYANHRIDVISNYNSNITKIPKVHVDYDIMADYYIIIKLSKNLKDFRILGYIKPDDIIMSYHDNDYYYPDKRLPLKDLFNIMLQNKKEIEEPICKHTDAQALFLRFLDNELSFSYKKVLIKHLLTCSSCAKRFEDFNNFHKIALRSNRYSDIVQNYFEKIGKVAPNKASSLYSSIKPPKNEFKIKEPSFIDIATSSKNIILGAINNFIDKPKVPVKKEVDEKTLSKQEAIEYIFHDRKSAFKEIVQEKKIVLLVSFIVIFLFGVLIFALSRRSNDELSMPEQVVENITENDSIDYNMETDSFYKGKSNDVINENGIEFAPIDTKDVYYSESYFAIKKVSFEVPSSISKDKTYFNFLQVLGKNVKTNLENDIVTTGQNPKGKTLSADIFLSKNGDISSVKIRHGVNQTINDIVEKNIANALIYVKPPKANADVEVTLDIEF